MDSSNKDKTLLRLLLIGAILLIKLADQTVEARDKGDDIILTKGKIIMRGGKGKGNIILDPGNQESHYSMPPIMPMMSHYNPFQFYPMHGQHYPEQHHQQPPMMIQPIYIEDHSALNVQPEPEPQQQQQQEQQQQQQEPQEYHHEMPQQHYEMEQKYYEPQQEQYQQQPMQNEQQQQEKQQEKQNYEQEGGEQQDGGMGEDEHHGEYIHPMISMMMHGSGPQPAYQQMSALQTVRQQQQPAMYAQLPLDQQAIAYQQGQIQAALAADQQAKQQLSSWQGQQASEVSQASPSSSSGTTSTSESSSSKQTGASKALSGLLEKSANNPLVQIIKPLFKRNKEHKDSSSSAASQQKQKS